MANRRGLSDLIKEEASKAAPTAEESTENTPAAEAAGTELAEKDKTIAKLEQSLERVKTELEAAQKEVLRLIDENKQLQSRPGLAPKASLSPNSTAKSPGSGEMVLASGILIAHAHKRGKVLIPDLVVNQDAENNKDFAANAWML